MRGRWIATIAMVAAMGCQTVYAQSSAATDAPRVSAQTDLRPIVIGLGAIAGVMVFNVAALGVEALPGGLGYAAGATVPAEMSVAMSRVYATASAVIGGWIGYYSVGR
jgi:hypothetical protein